MHEHNPHIPTVNATHVDHNPKPKMVLVQVPPGAVAGSLLEVPIGTRLFQVQVPPGVTQFYLSVPDEIPRIPFISVSCEFPFKRSNY